MPRDAGFGERTTPHAHSRLYLKAAPRNYAAVDRSRPASAPIFRRGPPGSETLCRINEAELIERAVSAVAASYGKTLDLATVGEPVLAVVLEVYFDGTDASAFTAYTFAVTRRRAEACTRDDARDDLWISDDEDDGTVQLQDPDIHVDPEMRQACEALLTHIDTTDDLDALERYYLQLAERLRASLGVPVIVTSSDGSIDALETDQLLPQLTPAEIEHWTANGWLD